MQTQGQVEPVGEDWSRPFVVSTIDSFRSGWKGAWDAFKSAWRKDGRLQVPMDVTFSVYVKHPAEEVTVFAAQLETDKGPSAFIPEENDS